MKPMLILFAALTLLTSRLLADSAPAKPAATPDDPYEVAVAALEKHVERTHPTEPTKNSKLRLFVVHLAGRDAPMVREIVGFDLTPPLTIFNTDLRDDGSQIKLVGEAKEVAPRRLELVGTLQVDLDYKVGFPHGTRGGSVGSKSGTMHTLGGQRITYGKVAPMGGMGMDNVGRNLDEQYYELLALVWL